MQARESSHANIAGLQILRAVAAIMVVVHHARYSVAGAESWPAFGETGVDIFFVISGFVMAYTTTGLPESSGIGSRLRQSSDFLSKRLLRIVPLYWLALLWTSRHDIAHAYFTSDLLKDFVFFPHSNAAFPQTITPTLQQGWTLNYEMFFYVLFAASLLFATRNTKVLVAALAVLVCAGIAFQFAGWPTGNGIANVLRRFYTDNIILEFGYGVLLQRAPLLRQPPDLTPPVFLAIAFGGLALLCLGHGHDPRALMWGLPAALIVWVGIHGAANVRSSPLELLGNASYAIYLFHWASFGAVKPLANWLAPASGHSSVVVILMLAHTLVAIAAGVFMHLAIEKPFMRWARARLLRRRASPVVAGTA